MQNRNSRQINFDQATIHLLLLGPMEVHVGDQQVVVTARKARALLAYLALRLGEAVPRETLAGVFWGDRDEEQARASLRQTLSTIRRALGEKAANLLVTSNESATLVKENVWVDVAALEHDSAASDTGDLEYLTSLYRGEFLEGLNLNEPEFDQWLTAEREQARSSIFKILTRLIERMEYDRRIEDAIAYAARLLTMDSLQEQIHCKLMRLYMAQGRYDVALNQFEQCRRELSEQLDVAPEKATLDIVKEIRARRRQTIADTNSGGKSSTLQSSQNSETGGRLATVLVAKIADNSRLLQDIDEEQITKRMAQMRESFFNQVSSANGTVFEGGEDEDGFIVEFASPEKAVHCAVEIQRDLALLNRDIVEDKKILLKIGIHLENIIAENGMLLGAGVNTAACIEASCEPGKVQLSKQVFDQISEKAGLGFDCLGPQSFKNNDGTTTIYVVAGEAGINRLIDSPRREDTAPALPDKPSIAVLPFVNMSDDSEQEYFSDGITEDIITELSRFKSIFVISRHASFAYKGGRIDPGQIGRELGVGFLLEGSIRRLGPRIRITAQLIDTKTNNHVWADRYDAQAEELFDIQDELVKNIVATIAGRIEVASMAAAKRKPPESLEAYDCLLKGLAYHQIGGISLGNAEQAVQWIDKAIELSPDFARAHAWRACAGGWNWLHDDEGEWFRRGDEEVQLALEIDPNEPEAHRIAGAINLYKGDFQKSEYHHLRAMELNPNDAYLMGRSAVHFIAVGDCEKALELLSQAMRQDPFLPDWVREEEAVALYFLNRNADAIIAFKSLINPSRRALCYWTASQAGVEDDPQTEAVKNALLRIDPEFSISAFLDSEPPFANQKLSNKAKRDLTEAGLPI